MSENFENRNLMSKGLLLGMYGVLTGGAIFALISYLLEYEYFVLSFILGVYISFLFITGNKNSTKNVYAITAILALIGILFTDFLLLLLIAVLDYDAILSIDLLSRALTVLIDYETYSPLDTVLLFGATIVGALSVASNAQGQQRQRSIQRYRQLIPMMPPQMQKILYQIYMKTIRYNRNLKL